MLSSEIKKGDLNKFLAIQLGIITFLAILAVILVLRLELPTSPAAEILDPLMRTAVILQIPLILVTSASYLFAVFLFYKLSTDWFLTAFFAIWPYTIKALLLAHPTNGYAPLLACFLGFIYFYRRNKILATVFATVAALSHIGGITLFLPLIIIALREKKVKLFLFTITLLVAVLGLSNFTHIFVNTGTDFSNYFRIILYYLSISWRSLFISVLLLFLGLIYCFSKINRHRITVLDECPETAHILPLLFWCVLNPNMLANAYLLLLPVFSIILLKTKLAKVEAWAIIMRRLKLKLLYKIQNHKAD